MTFIYTSTTSIWEAIIKCSSPVFKYQNSAGGAFSIIKYMKQRITCSHGYLALLLSITFSILYLFYFLEFLSFFLRIYTFFYTENILISFLKFFNLFLFFFLYILNNLDTLPNSNIRECILP